MADEGLLGVPMSFGIGDTLLGSLGTGLARATPKMISPYASTGTAIGLGLGSVLLQSLLGYQARQQAADRTIELNKLSTPLLGMQTAQERSNYLSGLEDTDPLVLSRLGTLSGALSQRDLDLNQKFREMQIERGFNPLTGQNIFSQLVPKPLEEIEQDLEGSLFGGETVDQKRQAAVMEGRALGLTPGQLNAYAEDKLLPLTTNIKNARKNLEKLREQNIESENLLATAQAGMEGAGQTGGPSLYRGLRETASSLYQYSPTSGGKEEAQQRASQKQLDMVRPKIVQTLRSPGAVSNYETQILIGAGPSSENTRSENEAIIENMRVVTQLNNDYADFKELYISEKGTDLGADVLWQEYKDAEVFREGKFNKNRMPWKQYVVSKRKNTYTPSQSDFAVPLYVEGEGLKKPSEAMISAPETGNVDKLARLQQLRKMRQDMENRLAAIERLPKQEALQRQ